MTVETTPAQEEPLEMQPEPVRYASSDIRCPACHQWRAQIWIEADGRLRCRPCPALGRRSRARHMEKGSAA